MGKFCGDFNMRRKFEFPLEYERDPITNKSEVERFQEISIKKGNSDSKTAREYVLEGMKKDEHMLTSMNPKLEQFIGESKPEEYVPMEPTLADYKPIHEDFISKSTFSLEELKRRAQVCLSLSKLYDEKYQYDKHQAFEESRQKRHDIEKKNEEIWVG